MTFKSGRGSKRVFMIKTNELGGQRQAKQKGSKTI